MADRAEAVDATTAAEESLDREQKARARNSVIYGSSGTVIEWFDYGLYLYLVPVVSPLFFPSSDPIFSVLATLGVFAAGSVLRVAGGAFYGSIGDRLGRKRALVLSIVLMTVPMVLMAVLPTYAAIGIAAPILFTVMRMVQGFSAGGEYSGAMVQLVEQAPAKRRGFVTGSVVLTSGIGILLASVSVLIMRNVLDPAQISDWGWRVLYLFGGVLGLFALLMRRRMMESEAFEKEQEEGSAPKQPLRYAFRYLAKPIAITAIIAGYGNLLYFVIVGFVPDILEEYSPIDDRETFLVVTLMTALFAFATPFFGLWSDKVGRKPLMITGIIGYILLAIPLLWVFSFDPLIWAVFAGIVALFFLMLFYGPLMAVVGEQFPSRARYSALATGYNIGSGIIGGTAPLVAAWTITAFGTPVAPAYFLIVASIVTLPFVIRLKETKGISLEELDAAAPKAEWDSATR